MSKIVIFITPVISLIPWIFPSVEWYWKCIITLSFFILGFVAYYWIIHSNLKSSTVIIDGHEKSISKLESENHSLKVQYEQEKKYRKNVALLYTNTDKDLEVLLNQVDLHRSEIHNIFLNMNQIKTKKDLVYVKALEIKTADLKELTEKEWNYVRERRISNNKNN